MKEIRNVNISFGKTGQGSDSYRINLPVPWIKALGFTKEDKLAIIEFDKNKIILKKAKMESK